MQHIDNDSITECDFHIAHDIVISIVSHEEDNYVLQQRLSCDFASNFQIMIPICT